MAAVGTSLNAASAVTAHYSVDPVIQQIKLCLPRKIASIHCFVFINVVQQSVS
jgi:hypothetical protein